MDLACVRLKVAWLKLTELGAGLRQGKSEMNPKSGTAGTAQEPVLPEEVFVADDADPGKVAKIKSEQAVIKEGKYGKIKVKPFKKAEQEKKKSKDQDNEKEKTSWIEIVLVDEDNKPVPNERYKVTLPDGSVAEWTLDSKGFSRVDGIDPGQCKVTFPDRPGQTWSKA